MKKENIFEKDPLLLNIENGIIQLEGGVDDDLLSYIPHIEHAMFKIAEKDKKRPIIFMWHTCPGGSAHIMNSFISLFKKVPNPIVTYFTGMSDSAATFIGMLSDYYIVDSFAEVMTHYGSTGSSRTDVNNFLNLADFTKIDREMTAELLSWRTSLPVEIANQLLSVDTFMTAYEAESLGIVDKVMEKFDPNFFKPENFMFEGLRRVDRWAIEHKRLLKDKNRFEHLLKLKKNSKE